MATSQDPLGKDQDGQSNVPADVQEINADFRRDLAFPTLTDDMVERLQGYGREEIVPENVTLYTHGDRDSDMFVVLDGGIDIVLRSLNGGYRLFVRSLVVELIEEGVELGLLLKQVGSGGTSGLLLQGQVHALMAAVLLGCPGRMRSMLMPSRNHHTASLERLNNPLGEAKGTPLSERIACGRPRSLNKRSKAVNAVFSAFDSVASHSSR